MSAWGKLAGDRIRPLGDVGRGRLGHALGDTEQLLAASSLSLGQCPFEHADVRSRRLLFLNIGASALIGNAE